MDPNNLELERLNFLNNTARIQTLVINIYEIWARVERRRAVIGIGHGNMDPAVIIPIREVLEVASERMEMLLQLYSVQLPEFEEEDSDDDPEGPVFGNPEGTESDTDSGHSESSSSIDVLFEVGNHVPHD